MADYPAAVTNYATAPTSGALGSTSPTQSELHDLHRAEIIAVQNELGTDPAGAWATVKARLAGLDGNVFHVDAYGAAGDGSTDDTAAIKAAIAAADAAGGGTVQFGAATYLVDGSLDTSEGGYSLLPVPASTSPIRFRGVAAPNQCDPRTDTGYSILKVTKTGLTRSGTYGVPSVIGGRTGGTWVESMVAVENLCVWLPANPTIAGVDLRFVRRALVDGLSVIAIDAGDSDYTEPTSVYAFGLRTPDPNNYNAVLVRNGQAHGVYAGLVGSVESMSVDYWVSKWCEVGWGVQAGGHGGSVSRISLEWCPYSVSGWSETAGATSVPTGPNGETVAQVAVNHLAVEDYAGASKWYEPVVNVNDSTDRIRGVVNFDYYLLGTGPGSSLSKNGGANLTTVSLYAPDFGAGGGGGATQYTKRDRLTAAAGDNLVTLGAAPIEDSAMVWVDSGSGPVLTWPEVEYTRAGATITFLSNLAAGDVVLVSYGTTEAAAADATIGAVALATFPYAVAALSPLAAWRLDSDDSVNILDYTGNSRALTRFGTISRLQASLLASGEGFSNLFDGGYGQIASAAWMETDYVSVVLRYKPRSGDLTGSKPLLTRWLGGTSTDYAWLLWLNAGKVEAHAKPNGGTSGSAVGATTLVAGTTYTIGMVWDGTTIKVYVDGAVDGSASLAGVLQKGSGAAVEMCRISGSTVGGGYLDEVSLFGTALSDSDMSTLHACAVNP